MRICIYKTDEAPDLTLLLREGLGVPSDAHKGNWTQFKVVTSAEVSSDLLTGMERNGYCLVRLGKTSSEQARKPISKVQQMKVRFDRWRRLPQFLRLRAPN